MRMAHTSNNGFWVATTGEVEKYLGYEPGRFGAGFMVGR